MTDSNAFDAALSAFILGAQETIDAEKLTFPRRLVKNNGRKYIRLTAIEGDSQFGSAWCFIERANGNVLKPASYARPAKHARGNIFDEFNGLKNITWTGPAYLR